jgi:hypothetical protein
MEEIGPFAAERQRLRETIYKLTNEVSVHLQVNDVEGAERLHSAISAMEGELATLDDRERELRIKRGSLTPQNKGVSNGGQVLRRRRRE